MSALRHSSEQILSDECLQRLSLRRRALLLSPNCYARARDEHRPFRRSGSERPRRCCGLLEPRTILAFLLRRKDDEFGSRN